MNMYLMVGAPVVLGLLAVVGIASVTTGWVVPWARARVLRPKLSGYGALLSAAGWAVFIYLGPLGQGYGVLAWSGWLAAMAGLGLQVLAQRPGRGVRGATAPAS
ncbi:hypothetical protein [Streptomyces alanosinicus]|uniref:Uncharacterized protein n=1 Tax=Streptomyces alanosinicus TaxID=68171 RepID=A0A918IN88_9ACTN|nr:hypothetical protein [Streptomyces alanosinicus]GGW23606.1 hypothetical protein GCM10010339_93460 [Streptomyces alanosinicus]